MGNLIPTRMSIFYISRFLGRQENRSPREPPTGIFLMQGKNWRHSKRTTYYIDIDQTKWKRRQETIILNKHHQELFQTQDCSVSAAEYACDAAQVRSMILPRWWALFHLLPRYLGSITSSDNKTVKQSQKRIVQSSTLTISHLQRAHSWIFCLSIFPWSRYVFSLGGSNLSVSFIPRLSVCTSHAELPFETNSWACAHVCQLGSYLVFQSQLASTPLGGPLSLCMGAQGKPWSQALTHNLYCICLTLLQLEASVTRSCGSMKWECSRLPCCASYLYPSFGGIPTVNPPPPDRGSRGKKKKKSKTRSTPKNSCNMCMLGIQQQNLHNKQLFNHTTVIHTCSSRWLHCHRKSDTV